MKKKRSILTYMVLLLFLTALILVACKNSKDNVLSDPSEEVIMPGPNAQAEIQQALLDAEAGDEIRFGEGTFDLTATLTMDNKTGVILSGSGRDQTVFSFDGLTSGSDGLLITNSEQIVIRDLKIQDVPGDALKVQDTDGIVIYRVDTVWSGEPTAENGSYGIYPVLSSNILIEDCYAFGASDAGIYVGQSTNAIVRNSRAEGNVAGIEIENTINADVYQNVVTDNTGGILVFDLPALTQNGSHIRVFENTVQNNSRANFAPPGSIVSEVPAGTGILVMSTDNVEIFENEIDENNLIGTGVFSFNSMIALGLMPIDLDMSYNPENINIHNNTYSRSNSFVPPQEQPFFGQVLMDIFDELPSVDFIPGLITDGFFPPGSDESGSVCMDSNGGNPVFMNLNIPNDFPENISMDSSPHNCSLDPLPAVDLNIPEYSKSH
jgi:parallel beta-helix repeat protein